MSDNLKQFEAAIRAYVDKDDALFLQRFFKTGVGQYGEGDFFIGIRVPKIRLVCKQFQNLMLDEIQKLLDSKIHEYRLAALIIMNTQYSKGNEVYKRLLYELYLKNVYEERINNWDLVDISAHHIIGEYLQSRPRSILFNLAKNENLWQRRVSIVSSFAFIKSGDASTSLELAEVLLHDKEDLIHKAVGWMLREAGKRCSEEILLEFLDKHAFEMPRTMLRYSLEHLSVEQKQYYMKQKILRDS